MKTLFHLMKVNELTNEKEVREIIHQGSSSADKVDELEDPELRRLALTSYYNVLCTMPAMVRVGVISGCLMAGN